MEDHRRPDHPADRPHGPWPPVPMPRGPINPPETYAKAHATLGARRIGKPGRRRHAVYTGPAACPATIHPTTPGTRPPVGSVTHGHLRCAKCGHPAPRLIQQMPFSVHARVCDACDARPVSARVGNPIPSTMHDVPATPPRSDADAMTDVYRMVDHRMCLKCGYCHQWTRVWGCQTATIGHFAFYANPRAGLWDPKKKRIEPAVKAYPKLRKADVCDVCAAAYVAVIADTDTDAGHTPFLDDTP